MLGHEEEPQELPDEVLDEVNRIMEGSEDDKSVNITLLGTDAFALLRYVYLKVKVSSDVKEFAEKWEKENLGIDTSQRFLDADNPESVEFNIYQQLVNQIPLGESGRPGTEPRPDLPELVSLNVTPRAIDTLNGDFLQNISRSSELFTYVHAPLSRRAHGHILVDTIGVFITLNAEAVEAGMPPRPSFTKFIQGLQ